MSMDGQDEITLDELSSIMNLQRQEAFDDSTEALHKTISKRGSLAPRTLSSAKVGNSSIVPEEENAEATLLKIITGQAGSTAPRRASHAASKQRSYSSPSKQLERRRSRSRGPSLRKQPEASIQVPENTTSDKDRRQYASRESRSTRERRSSSNPRGERRRSPSRSTRERRSPSNPRGERRRSRSRAVSDGRGLPDFYKSTEGLSIERSSNRSPGEGHQSPRRSSSAVGMHAMKVRREQFSKSGSAKSLVKRGSKDDASAFGDDGSTSAKETAKRAQHSQVRRRPSTLGTSISKHSQRSKSPSGSVASLSSAELKLSPTVSQGGTARRRSSSKRPSSRQSNRPDGPSSRQGSVSSAKGMNTGGNDDSGNEVSIERSIDAFDNIWTPDRPKMPSGRSGSKQQSDALGGYLHKKTPAAHDSDPEVMSLGTKETLSSHGRSGLDKQKKTKLEKIHELQAKCDRYKKEWIDTTRDKKKLRNDVLAGKAEILSMTKEIGIHVAETGILQKKLSETLENLDELHEEQRQERNEFSTTAKDLAHSRIEFANALKDARELQIDLDKAEEALREKDRRLADLEDDLKESKIKAEDLDSDLNFAEETVLRLEADMKRIEEELVQYREAAGKDTENENGEATRQVRVNMAKRLAEDRESQLQEKQDKLNEKMKRFDKERERLLEKEKERDKEFVEKTRQDSEESQQRDDVRNDTDDQINDRLHALESDKTMLQGRLKSEQLDTNVKLRQKDERIESLQKELTQAQTSLSDLDGDPNGAASLKKEVDAAKFETAALKGELEEAQKHNRMLTEEIGELQTGSNELRAGVRSLQQQVASLKKEVETWQRKSAEWETKSAGWTDKAYLWKDKAEHWEKVAKDAEPAASEENEPDVDPQALFLQAALERKKMLTASQEQGSKWNVLGTWMGSRVTSEEDSSESQERISELEAENSKNVEIIKNLRSEMIIMQAHYKDEAYSNQQKILGVVKEREAVESKNLNLTKELELARKLESFATQDL